MQNDRLERRNPQQAAVNHFPLGYNRSVKATECKFCLRGDVVKLADGLKDPGFRGSKKKGLHVCAKPRSSEARGEKLSAITT